MLVTNIFGSPATPPIPATLNPTYTGTPDALVLQQEAVSQRAPISFVLASGGIHDWVLLTPDGLRYWPQIDQELGA